MPETEPSESRGTPEKKSEKKKSGKSSRASCAFVFFGLILLVGLVVGGWLDHHLNIRSNLLYLEFNSSGNDLEVKSGEGNWAKLSIFNAEDMAGALISRFDGEGYSWETLKIRRASGGSREKFINAVIPSEVHVLTIDPEKFEFSPWFEKDASSGMYAPNNIRSAAAANPNAAFVINASYYDPDGQPLGLIIADSKPVNREFKAWSGFFYVANGKPVFGPRSLWEKEDRAQVTQCIQGYPSVMKNGEVFHYLDKAPDQFFNGSELTIRSLAAVKTDGKIVFVLSGQGALLKMNEVTTIAKLIGAKHATLLDGGRALQYRFSHAFNEKSFHSFNNTLDIEGRLAPERPPVFLIVEPK